MSNQLDLFSEARFTTGVRPATASADLAAVASRVPDDVYLGTSSWSFPGWAGIVYDRVHSTTRLANEGLDAYSRHPLLRTVSIDRSYYGPIDVKTLRRYHDAVPDRFRFVMKAHEACTSERFPAHARYGSRAGELNPLFLEPGHARDEVVAPFVDGLGDKGALLLFQFAPLSGHRSPAAFAERLGRFLDALPKGPRYGVELRNPKLLGREYRAAIESSGASHCFNVHPSSIDLTAQRVALDGVPGDGPVFVRWMLGPGLSYESAVEAYAPFDRLVAEDSPARRSIADLCATAHRVRKPSFVWINNKAEGSAPLSAARLAHAIVERIERDGDAE